MKKIYTVIAGLMLTVSVYAQAPEKMSYQAVIRDASNNLTTNQAVGMQISILQTTATGTAVYVETQTPTTNANGLVSLEIGTGTLVSGDFTTIDWANDTYFIKTETDPTGGTTYTITGTTQLMSVPYALHANTADSIIGGVSFTEVDGSVTNEIQDLQLSGNNLTITNNGSATTIDLSPYLDNTDTQLDSTDIANMGFVAGGPTYVFAETPQQIYTTPGYITTWSTEETSGNITHDGTTFTLPNGIYLVTVVFDGNVFSNSDNVLIWFLKDENNNNYSNVFPLTTRPLTATTHNLSSNELRGVINISGASGGVKVEMGQALGTTPSLQVKHKISIVRL